jgi:signal transduction histidine kinase
MTDFDLASVELFAGLPPADISRLENLLEERELLDGEILFSEGDAADNAYIVANGELEILKQQDERDVRLAVSGRGVVVGEMGLLRNEPRNATARALGPVTLIEIPQDTFNEIIETSAPAMRALFDVFVRRWQEQELRVRQSERMAQLGVLTAGLAHEMNNPAAAVTRGAEQLRPALERLEKQLQGLPAELDLEVGGEPPQLSALDRADREEALELTLERLGLPNPWEIAPDLVAAGITEDTIGALQSGEDAAVLVAALASRAEVSSLLAEILEGSKRLSEMVLALKSYSFLDQAPVQETDIGKGIQDTLLILRSKIKDISVELTTEPDLPSITAFGSQLNQVWTNLIDNAADALSATETPQPAILIRARRDGDHVIVEVEDNGPGIPEDVVGHVFEAFYTTKAPGSGTGIGLNTVYSIVVNDHRGTIDVQSQPGSTVFRVRLPIELETGS